MSPPPRLHYAQLHGSTHSPTKYPPSSLLSLMISPGFIPPESRNRLTKFRENNWGSWDMASSLSQTLHCPNLCEIWACVRQPLSTGNMADLMPKTSPLFLVSTIHQQRCSLSFWCEMTNQEPLISGCNRALEKTQTYFWGYITCRWWWWLKCGMCLDVRRCILASSKDCPATVVRVSEGMCPFRRAHSRDSRV